MQPVVEDRHFRAVFSDAADALLIVDDDGVICEANRAAGELFGVAPDSLKDWPFESLLLGGHDQLPVALREMLALGESRREQRVTDGHGGARLVESTFRARVHANRHLCVARDVTDRRLLEERIMQAEKIESLGRLAGGIAHDFNNLLTAVLGYAELLLGHKAPGDPDRGDIEEIHKAGTRASALTQQLLAFSRKQVLLPKEVDLNRTVSELKAMLTRLIREDIRLVCTPAPAPAVAKLDPIQIEQVILNLVLNARDALPAGGTIRVEVAVVPPSDADVPRNIGVIASEYVRLTVADDGIGIAPDALPHLFEPFYTTKDTGKGTGLGLATVYGIVHQSSGFITVDSAPGQGSTFRMYFPALSAAVEEPVASASPAAETAAGHETVLLVEDEPAVRAIIAKVLRRQGYQVMEAATPGAAIELVDRHAGTIDLLVTDVVMPEINGPALAQRLVAARPGLRILFISGYADRLLRLDGSNPHVGFLGKPFQASVLTSKVREMLAVPTRA